MEILTIRNIVQASENNLMWDTISALISDPTHTHTKIPFHDSEHTTDILSYRFLVYIYYVCLTLTYLCSFNAHLNISWSELSKITNGYIYVSNPLSQWTNTTTSNSSFSKPLTLKWNRYLHFKKYECWVKINTYKRH